MGTGEIVNNRSLEGYQIGKWAKGEINKADDNKLNNEITKPLINNGKDDVVIQDNEGHRYTVTSEQIIFADNKPPSANTNVSFISSDGDGLSEIVSGIVIYSDNEKPDENPLTLKLSANSGMELTASSDERLKVRELRAEVTDKMLEKFEKKSNLDSIVLKTADGKRLIICADEINPREGYKMPVVGQKVIIGGVEGEVSRINTSKNEELNYFDPFTLGAANLLSDATEEHYNMLDEISFTQDQTNNVQYIINLK